MAGKQVQEDSERSVVAAARPALNAGKVKSKKPASKKPKRNQRPPRAVRLSQAERRYNPAPAPRHGVSVTVHIGKPRVPARLAPLASRIKLPKAITARLQALPAPVQRYKAPITVILVALILSIPAYGVYRHAHKPSALTGKVAAAERTEPDFKPLVPSDTEAGTASYDGKRNMVSYSSTFSGARLTVSQQPLPARFLRDPKALQAAADSINAKQQLTTNNGPLFIASNEAGDQLAIFAGTHVLLFIHSDRKLDDPSWKAFVELLKEK